ncbi:MAG: hypothetical protein PHH14_04455 [Candidatus Margulisbacteria bacterium]|nr:hypothetical protein [Candidatus Margulisiibacteriota bacterium]
MTNILLAAMIVLLIIILFLLVIPARERKIKKSALASGAYDELIRQEREKLRTLQENTIALGSIQDSDQLLKVIVENAKRISGAVLVAITLIDTKKNVLEVKYVSGLSNPLIQTALKMLHVDPTKLTFPVVEGSIIKGQIDSHQTYVTDSFYVLMEKKIDQKLCDAVQKLTGIDKICDICLMAGDKFIGQFVCFMRVGVEADISLLETFARQCAQAISSVDVITKIKEQVDEVERMNKFMIGREMEIVNLKNEINEMLAKQGALPKYRV